MTQTEMEAKLLEGYIKYTEFLADMFNIGKQQQEALANFYKHCNGVVLTDRRVRKMYSDTAELNKHIEEYVLNSMDEIKLMGITIEEIATKLEGNQ